MTPGAARTGILLLTLAAVCTACGGDPTGPGAESAALSVSDVSALGGMLAGGSRAGFSLGRVDEAEPGVTWVSLPAGTVPRGRNATITNRATGASVASSLVDGGLDPVRIPAEAGDSIDVAVTDSAGGTVLMFAKVPLRRSPAIIRTQPPRRRTSVPLNARIVIVFSEPMNGTTLNGGTVTLERDAAAVPGAVIITSGGVVAEFIPEHELDPGVEYTLRVTTAARDLDGEPMDVDFSTEFTSGTGRSTAAGIEVLPSGAARQPGDFIYFTASLIDTQGNPVTGPAPTWTTSDMAVAGLEHAGAETWNLARAVTPGSTRITATAEGLAGSATLIVSPLSFTSLALGFQRTCGATRGFLYCWGNNHAADHVGSSEVWTTVPRLAADGMAAKTVAIAVADSCQAPGTGDGYEGCEYSCALTTGAAWCWGINVGRHPIRIAGPDFLTELVAGERHACALSSTGTAECWGSYRLGADSTSVLLAPATGPAVPVAAPARFVAIAAGGNHDCAIDADARLFCWGNGTSGQRGASGAGVATLPLQAALVTMPPIRSVSAGLRHTCAVTLDERMFCWGSNDAGQLGIGGVDWTAEPTQVGFGIRWTAVSAGTHHSCGLSLDGTAYCWGENLDGQLGNTDLSRRPPPFPVETGLRFVSIMAGNVHTCAMGLDGAAYCWGRNREAALGIGSVGEDPVTSPTRVALQR
jgi:hypothetical protein